jgi:hypothetical protein
VAAYIYKLGGESGASTAARWRCSEKRSVSVMASLSYHRSISRFTSSTISWQLSTGFAV